MLYHLSMKNLFPTFFISILGQSMNQKNKQASFFVKILISAGYPHQNGRYVEIIDLIDPYSKCEFVKDQPQKVQRYQKSSPKHSGKYVLTYQSTNLATFRNKSCNFQKHLLLFFSVQSGGFLSITCKISTNVAAFGKHLSLSFSIQIMSH